MILFPLRPQMLSVAVVFWTVSSQAPISAAEPPNLKPAGIIIIDSQTSRGVPLIELETVDGVRYVTDNAGRVAIHEPDLIGRECYFSINGHGYERKPDGFGFRGASVTLEMGKTTEIRIVRKNLAERMCRLTGEGRWRDSQLLGYDVPRLAGQSSGRVAGQDSIQAAVFSGRVYWFWGDTLRLNYPLGMYRTAGATSPIPDAKTDLSSGIGYHYFTDPKTSFARAMMPLPERPDGVIWIDGVCVLPDELGRETMLAHYSRRKGLADELEHGIAQFNQTKAIFQPVKTLPLTQQWQRPSNHAIAFDEAGTQWLLFGSPTPNVRVRATLNDVLDSARYEAFTCMTQKDSNPPTIARGTDGKPLWRWQTSLPPMESKHERDLVKAGKLRPDETRFYPADRIRYAKRITLHNGTVRWNIYRKKWIMLAGQVDGNASHLGEVWYTEADHPTGPFTQATQILTHDRQTFYNVCHHAFLDQDDGKTIYFEGTYTNDFSGNPQKTARYNYNQILYRLDLSQPGLNEPKPAK